MRRLTYVAVPLTLAAVMALPGTAATSKSAAPKYPPIPKGPIVFGVSVPLSGATAAFGLSTKTSFDNVTVPNFNKNFPTGILGHHVKFEILDDASDVTKAVQVANQLVSDKVVAVVTASYNPAATAQQIAVFTKNKVPYLGARGETEYQNTAKYPYVFNIGASVPTGAKALSKWVAKHTEIRKIAILDDGLPATDDGITQFLDALKTDAPTATVTKKVNFPPGASDVSAPIAELKATNPDLLYVGASFQYGPIWQAIQAANWSPRIYVGAGAFYDSFKAMGPLAENAVTETGYCVAKDRGPLPPALVNAMDGYEKNLGANTTNYIIYSGTDDIPVYLIKAAIEKYKSTSPDAIKRALEEMNNYTIFDSYKFTFTPTNHDGLKGEFATAICNMAEDKYAFGRFRVPTLAD